MTKSELIEKGKSLGLTLNQKMLKAEMEDAISKAEKKQPKEKKSTSHHRGEGGFR